MRCLADINTARCYGILVNVYRFPLQAVRLAAAILTFRQPHRFFSSLLPHLLPFPRRCLSEVLAFLVFVFLLNSVYLPFFFFFFLLSVIVVFGKSLNPCAMPLFVTSYASPDTEPKINAIDS